MNQITNRKSYRVLLVERIRTKSNNRCWFTTSQNLKLKFDDNEEPIPFDQDFGRNFYDSHIDFIKRIIKERAYIDFIKRIIKDNSDSKEFVSIESTYELSYI